MTSTWSSGVDGRRFSFQPESALEVAQSQPTPNEESERGNGDESQEMTETKEIGRRAKLPAGDRTHRVITTRSGRSMEIEKLLSGTHCNDR
jgi:hypothetical protein